jgi:beta-glucoside operon transcriptional antiterminator
VVNPLYLMYLKEWICNVGLFFTEIAWIFRGMMDSTFNVAWQRERKEPSMYKIARVINNNFVMSKDENNQEIIVRGLGIGFHKTKGDLIPEEKIEKIYRMDTPKQLNHLIELVESMPVNYISVCTEIIENIQRHLGKKLSRNIYVTLTDHLCFALERKKNGLEYKNEMLWEIRNFYHDEFKEGEYAVAVIKDRLGIELSEDEAAFIALHIVNAELETGMSDMWSITKMIEGILKIVEDNYHISFDQDTLAYGRFITHLKFLGQRIFKGETKSKDESDFEMMVEKFTQGKYKKEYLCAKQIQSYIQSNFGHLLSNEDIFFLWCIWANWFIKESSTESENDILACDLFLRARPQTAMCLPKAQSCLRSLFLSDHFEHNNHWLLNR